MIECSWKSTFGIDCLTCGFQRSVELLFKGELYESFYMFPATIPLVLTFLYSLLHLKFKFSHGATRVLTMFSISALLIVINYTLKLSTGEVFHDLAFH